MAINPLVKIEHGRHGVEHDLTPHQLLAAAELHIGMSIRLPFHSSVDNILVDEDRLGVSYIKYTVDVRTHETRYTGAERVLDVYTRDAGRWARTDQFRSADDTFQPHAVHESGRTHRDEAEQTTRRTFEGDCHRPGTSKSPMDNAERTAEGYTTDKMARHWA